ncbi:uncharacterized protein LOC142348776 isoform X2 [Convolutriloba macropyga]|uniref:uncharacterized protein LOC142348776 isoform X2 n=1 Tax=Convolutriloba macropyga TaxID=536237 RepID=UPI003F520486
MNKFEPIQEHEASKFDTNAEEKEKETASTGGEKGGGSGQGRGERFASLTNTLESQDAAGGGVSSTGRNPYQSEGLDQGSSRRSGDGTNYISQYARQEEHSRPSDTDKESMESRREARPRFPSLSTGLNMENPEAEQMRQQRYRARGMNRPTSTAGGHSMSPRPVISALEKGKLKRSYSIDRARGYTSMTQRKNMLKHMRQMKSEQQIVHNSNLILAGQIPVKHSKRNLNETARRLQESECSSRMPRQPHPTLHQQTYQPSTVAESQRHPHPPSVQGAGTGAASKVGDRESIEKKQRRPSDQTIQTGVSAGWYTMGMYGCGIDLPLQFVKPPSVLNENTRQRLPYEESVMSEDDQSMAGTTTVDGVTRDMGITSQYSRRRIVPSGTARCSTGIMQPEASIGYRQAHGALRSMASRNNMTHYSRPDSRTSSYVPVTVAPDGASLFSVMPLTHIEEYEDEDIETIISRDVVHSYSTADSADIPSPDGDYVMHGPEPKHKMNCEEIRYLVAIFIIRFLHTGFLDLDFISFVRAMDETGHDGLWFITVRFASSCLTSAILICWFCKCYGARVLHMRSWVSVFVVAVLNAMGYLWVVCDTYTKRLQLYLFLVLVKGVFYCEGGAITALIMCVVFSPDNYKLVRAVDLIGIIAGDLSLGCFCSEIYNTFKLEWTSVTFAVLGAFGTLVLAFLIPFRRNDAISIIAARQGIIKDKFKEFGQLLKIPQVCLSCLMYISINHVLYAGGFIYNLYFAKLYGTDKGATVYTVYWGLSSVCSLTLTLILGFIKDPGKRICYVIMWSCGALPPLFCYLLEPPNGMGYDKKVSDSEYMKVIGLVIVAMLTVPFRIFSMCVIRYYVIEELFVSACLLLNLADNLGRCLCPIMLQVLYTQLGAAWANLSTALFHLLLVIIDIIVCTIDWKRSKKLEKLLEKEEEELRQQEEFQELAEFAEATDAQDFPDNPPLEAIHEESDHGMKSGEKQNSVENGEKQNSAENAEKQNSIENG